MDPEKEWRTREGADDPWAGKGMDEAEETLPEEPSAGEDADGESNFSGKTKKDDNRQSTTGSQKRILR